ncbi:hypothetical protein M2324_003503 [Rhodovulum sulfidophilum]|nr:hypothetical protein [Rhodovulum sulfidophilum]
MKAGADNGRAGFFVSPAGPVVSGRRSQAWLAVLRRA